MSSNPDRVKLSARELARENPNDLMRVLDSVADPCGSEDRYRLAWEIARQAFTETDAFEEAVKRYLAWLRSETATPFWEWVDGGDKSVEAHGEASLLSPTLN